MTWHWRRGGGQRPLLQWLGCRLLVRHTNAPMPPLLLTPLHINAPSPPHPPPHQCALSSSPRSISMRPLLLTPLHINVPSPPHPPPHQCPLSSTSPSTVHINTLYLHLVSPPPLAQPPPLPAYLTSQYHSPLPLLLAPPPSPTSHDEARVRCLGARAGLQPSRPRSLEPARTCTRGRVGARRGQGRDCGRGACRFGALHTRRACGPTSGCRQREGGPGQPGG